MSSDTERESVHYDVVVVGGGPAGLATAIRLKQRALASASELSVCVLEKGAELGAHSLSGAVLDRRGLDELLPDAVSRDAPLAAEVRHDEFYFLTGETSSFRVPRAFVPPSMHNTGQHIVSLGELSRWLGERAAALGVDVLPGFAAADVIKGDDGAVAGVVTSDRGISRSGERKAHFEPGIALRCKHTVLAEGARGHLGRRLIEAHALAAECDPQHYALGLKEVWEVGSGRHRPGLVVHGSGWPLSPHASGGFFAYHYGNDRVAIGLIVDLNYTNPWLSPYDEFQRLKQHALFRETLRGGRRIAYGARAIAKGGLHCLPKLSVPGALLVGCEAGTLNFAKIKGIHTAMKSGIVAADTIFDAWQCDELQGRNLEAYRERLLASWVGEELRAARNVQAALHRYGRYAGGALVFLEQVLFRGRAPWTLHDRVADHASLQRAAAAAPIRYSAPDGVLSFDKASSVYLSGTNHDEDQPSHLTLIDPELPVRVNLPEHAAPEQRYCPAGVYEIVEGPGEVRLQVNAQNCVHCKACDIKDPRQNIVWLPPESGGPAYPNM